MMGWRGSVATWALLGCVVACASGQPGAPPSQPAPRAPAATTPGPSPRATPTPVPAPPPGQPAPGGGFPTPQELDELGEGPAPGELFSVRVARVDEWQLTGPFPERVGALPYSDESPWSRLLEEAVRSRAGLVVPTEAMHCAARELGLFHLAHRSPPSDGLRRFITARCHASVAQIGFGFVDGPIPPDASEAQVFEHWRRGLEETIRNSVTGGPRTVGVWFGESQGHAVAMVAFGYRQVHVEPFSPFADADGRIEIRGEALSPTVAVNALLNRGAYGVAACEADPEVVPPRFHFACEVDRRDASTRIAISLTPPQRLLARAGLGVLAWPSQATENVYWPPRSGRRRELSEGDDVAAELVDLLNRVRRDAGLSPVELDRVQSQRATALAPHFFAAMLGRSPGVAADLVVLGMIAGWSVEGIVQSGHFAAAWVVRSNDLAELLGAALEYPVSRETLLAPEIDRIAVGPLLDATPGSEAMAAVFASYSLFSGESHDAFASRVYQKLEAERSREGNGAPDRLEDVSSLCQRAASAVEAGADPQDALRGLLQGSAQVLDRSVSGWIAEVQDLDDLEFPREYLSDPTFAVAVSVSHHRREGEPWGRYVVMLVVADPEVWGT